MLVFISKAPERSLHYGSRRKSPGLLIFPGNRRILVVVETHPRFLITLAGQPFVLLECRSRVFCGDGDSAALLRIPGRVRCERFSRSLSGSIVVVAHWCFRWYRVATAIPGHRSTLGSLWLPKRICVLPSHFLDPRSTIL